MANVFKGEADRRQSREVAHTVSRFRPTYRALTEEEKVMHDAIKLLAEQIEKTFYEAVPECRERSIAITKLEESIMWVIKGLTGNPPKMGGYGNGET